MGFKTGTLRNIVERERCEVKEKVGGERERKRGKTDKLEDIVEFRSSRSEEIPRDLLNAFGHLNYC